MLFPSDVTYDEKLCRLQINNLRKTRPIVESESKFHIGHIYREIQYEFEQISLRVNLDPEESEDVDFAKSLFSQTDTIIGAPSLINTLIHECIKHNCSPQFLRDVIDQYDSNGEVSGMRLLVALNRLRRGIWEYNILERVEYIERMYSTWSFRKCVFEMEAINEVKPSLYNRPTLITKLLFKSNHYPKLENESSNSMVIFDKLHDEFLESSSANSDKEVFSFNLISSTMLLDCMRRAGLDVDSPLETSNPSYHCEAISKKRKL